MTRTDTVTKYELPIKFVVLIRTTNQLICNCIISCHGIITAISIKFVPEQSEKVKYERETFAGNR